MFRMTAFVQNLQISLMAAPNADQDIGLVMFAEVSAETALTILNRFQILPPLAQHGSNTDRS